MKKKKSYGLFGTNKRKPAKRADKYTNDAYEEYDDEEYDTEYYGEEEDGVYYEDGNYGVEEYAESESYEEAYDESQAYYEDETYADGEEYYEEEAYTEGEEYYEEEAYAEDEAYYEEEAYAEGEAYYEEETYADTEEYYEDEEEYLYAEYDNEEGFDTGYEGYEEYADSDYYEETEEEDEAGVSYGFLDRIKDIVCNLTAFDAILGMTGVVILVAALVTFSMMYTSNKVEKQIQALAPIGTELSGVGIVGEYGLLAMAEAGLAVQDDGQKAPIEVEDMVQTEEKDQTLQQGETRVSVSFTSIEKDLKIRFTDAATGALITGTAFEVTLTNQASGNKMVAKDDNMDGIIHVTNMKAGKFDAVIASTDKYKFPSSAQQVTVKDKVEYVVVNVQDEVKKESEVNVAVEDTEVKADAVTEEVKLTDTVQWVEPSRQVVSGTEGYTKVDKNTIPDPSQLSFLRERMLFDTLQVSLNQSSLKLYAGSSATLTGTAFQNEVKESGDTKTEYQYTTKWESSNEKVATVSNGTVTAKDAGTATITYTVTRKTITTKTIIEPEAPSVEESTGTPESSTTPESSSAPESSSEPESSSTPESSSEPESSSTSESSSEGSSADQEVEGADEPSGENVQAFAERKTLVAGARAKTKTEVTENVETFKATCEVTVEKVQISSGSLELTKTADACGVGDKLTVKPSKLIYTKNDGSTQTLTEGFPTVFWSSSDTSIASIDSSTGVVTGVKQGTVTITGQIKGIKDASGKELDIRATTTVKINPASAATIKLDKEKATVEVGKTITLKATIEKYTSNAGVAWKSEDEKIAKVAQNGEVTGVAVGTVKITATLGEKDASGKNIAASCVVTVVNAAATDKTSKLKDKDGRQVYIKNSDGKYVEAVYADYFTAGEFFIMNEVKYLYTGWQTVNGRTYYYDKSGKAVTGTQIIQGVTYNFGSDGAIQTNVNGSTFGIDVSKHNGTIDWNAVKSSGVDYVIIRCAYRGSSTGALIEDPKFHTNIKGATAAGLKVGIYVFSQAVNEVEAVQEASLAVSLAKNYHLTYPIFIDTEESGGRADKIDVATRTAVVNAFCQTVKNSGYKAGIYASKSWYEKMLNMSGLNQYTLWLAQYAAAPTYKGRYDMWQYSCKGTINGIKGKVDLNMSYLGY